jgi:proteasome lid subunit RPN8/RPN11
VQERLVQSRRLVGFIGAWHTHPRHLAVPSVIDQAAMEEMAADNNSPVLLMIIGDNTGDLWQPWIAGSGRPSWYARLYFPR